MNTAWAVCVAAAFLFAGSQTWAENIDSSFSKLVRKLDVEMQSKYFQEYSDYMSSEEFEAVLAEVEKFAKANDKNQRFYIAGFIRGVSDYCNMEVLLRGNEHGTNPMNSRWKVKNDEQAGYLDGAKFGKEIGDKIFDRLQKDFKRKLKEHE